MQWLTGPAVVVVIAAELYRSYGSFPFSPFPPVWALAALLCLELWGIISYRQSRKCAWFTTGLSLTLTWAAVGRGQALVSRYIEVLAQNPYTPFSPGVLVRGIFLFLVGAGLTLAFVLWRFLDSRLKSSPVAGKAGKEANISLPLPPHLFSRKMKEKLDVDVCRDVKTKKPIVIKEHDRYLHTLVIGPTGCGKTSRVIKPMIWQDLKRLVRGARLGITVIEPKGDLVDEVAELCQHLNIPYTMIDPVKPDSARFNPLEGEAYSVAETTRTVLKSTFGKQDAFFAQVQETAARNVIMLLKELKGDNLDIADVVRTLQNPDTLSQYVDQLETLRGKTELTQYFRDELLGRLKDKYMQFAIGIRQQLADLMGNPLLRPVLTGRSTVNLDRHLEGGHVLLINTAMGQLGRLGDIFGEFMIMHLENAVFRRPGTEWTRTPHFLYIDEAPRYVNPDLERLLAIGRGFRCATLMAIQSGAQFELVERAAFKTIALTNCRHKLIFGGLTGKEAKEFELELGSEEKVRRESTYDHRMLLPAIMPRNYRTVRKIEPRYTYTEIMEMNKFRMFYRITANGSLQLPGIGEGRLVTLPGRKEKQAAKATTVEQVTIREEKANVIVFQPKHKSQSRFKPEPKPKIQAETRPQKPKEEGDNDKKAAVIKEAQPANDDFWQV